MTADIFPQSAVDGVIAKNFIKKSGKNLHFSKNNITFTSLINFITLNCNFYEKSNVFYLPPLRVMPGLYFTFYV